MSIPANMPSAGTQEPADHARHDLRTGCADPPNDKPCAYAAAVKMRGGLSFSRRPQNLPACFDCSVNPGSFGTAVHCLPRSELYNNDAQRLSDEAGRHAYRRLRLPMNSAVDSTPNVDR